MVQPIPAGAKEALSSPVASGYANQIDLNALALLGYLVNAEGEKVGIDALRLMSQEQDWSSPEDNDQEAPAQGIDLTLLEGIRLVLPGIDIPLIGDGGLLNGVLLDDSVGLLRKYAHTPRSNQALASVGAVNDDGSLNLSNPGDGGNIELDLTSLLELDDALEPMLSEASLSLGALSSSAAKPDAFLVDEGVDVCPADYSLVRYDQLQHPELGSAHGVLIGDPTVLYRDDQKFCSNYQIADAMLTIQSPLVTEIVSGVDELLNGLDALINGLISSEALVSRVLGAVSGLTELIGTGLDVSVEVPIADISKQILAEPLSDSTGPNDPGLLSIDLENGTIQVDLKQLHNGNLDELAPNTPLISATQLNQILDTVSSLLTDSTNPNSLIALLNRVVTGDDERGGLYGTEVKIELRLLGPLLGLDLKTTLGGLLNDNIEKASSEQEYLDDSYGYYFQKTVGLGFITGRLFDLILPLLGEVGRLLDLLLLENDVVSGLVESVLDDVVNPVLTSLNPLLRGVVRPIADTVVNRQKVEQTADGNVFTATALEVNVLQSAALHLPLATAVVMAESFDPAPLELGKTVVLKDPDLVLSAADYAVTIRYTCIDEDFERAYEGITDEDASAPDALITDRLEGEVVVIPGTREMLSGLPAGAECTFTEDIPTTESHLKWTLGWVDQPAWEEAFIQSSDSYTVTLDAASPQFLGAVNMYEWNLIDLSVNTAAVGTARGLRPEGYNYQVVCNADPSVGWSGIEETMMLASGVIGDGYIFTDNQLQLSGTGDSLGAPEPFKVLPGSSCEVSTTSGIEANPALRVTGGDRQPYTYLLTNDGDQVQANPGGTNPTVSVGDTGRVTVDVEDVNPSWKTHDLAFEVPENATDYSANIVHGYDMDTQTIVVDKHVVGTHQDETPFDFSYQINNGLVMEKTIKNGDSFTANVPVLNQDLKPSQFTISEFLGQDLSGPVVGWELNEGEAVLEIPVGTEHGTVSFEVGPVSTADQLTTPAWNLTVTNEYAQIALDKTIDGALPGDLASTTILSPTADEMTIRYTVENLGVDGDTAIQIQDKSLLDYEFVLPEGIEVSEDGTITGCTFEFVEGVATCSITVGIPDSADQDFRYEAAQAEATATLTVEVGDRTVIASATDGHGALRLSKLAGMLPATGVTTLVWTLGLGLLIAVGSVVYFVRSRRD